MINKRSYKQRMRSYLSRPSSLIAMVLVVLAALITLTVLLFLIGYIFVKGLPHLSWKLFEWEYNSENVSMMHAIINTIIITFVSLLIAVPFGLFTAIYMVEYASSKSRLVRIVRMMAETLAGIPSIVYGLFGMLFFVTYMHMGLSILSGAATLSIMILPLIMRTAEEALISVPISYREASFGLGAGRLRTVFNIVLPAAVPGIMSGVILSIGRIVGETAALLYTAGTVTHIPSSLLGSGRTLSVHMYALATEGLHIDEAYATAAVLLLIVFGINAFSALFAKRLMRGRK